MQKRSSKKDINVIASLIVGNATDEAHIVKNPAAAALGRLGGLKGGGTRAVTMSRKRRVEITRNAARARWGK